MGAPLEASLSSELLTRLSTKTHVRREPRVRIPCLGYRFLRPNGSVCHELFTNSRERMLRSNGDREQQRRSAPQGLRNAVLAHAKACNHTDGQDASATGATGSRLDTSRLTKSMQTLDTSRLAKSPDGGRRTMKKTVTHGGMLNLKADRFVSAACKHDLQIAMQEQAFFASRVKEQVRIFQMISDHESLKNGGTKASRTEVPAKCLPRQTTLAAMAEISQKLQELNVSQKLQELNAADVSQPVVEISGTDLK